MKNAVALVIAFAVGAGVGASLQTPKIRDWFASFSKDTRSVRTHDASARLTSYPNKEVMPCPAQTPRTKVLLLLGQSNAANHAGQRYTTTSASPVVNYFDGQCYRASSPLLGATGFGGEPWTLLGNQLVSSGAADHVVLVPFAIAGAPIEAFTPNTELHRTLIETLKTLRRQYQITDVLWHQGEADYIRSTPSSQYSESFDTLAYSLRDAGVAAPIYVSIATRCDAVAKWESDNPISRAQRAMPNPTKNIVAGVDTDRLIERIDRHDDCHFGASGQEKFARAWMQILARDK